MKPNPSALFSDSGLFRKVSPGIDLECAVRKDPSECENTRSDVKAVAVLRFEVIPAAVDDIDTVLEILDGAAAWVKDHNLPHVWVPGGFPRETFLDQISHGEVYVGWVDGKAAGTFVLQWSDVFWWGEMPPDAGYVHKLAIRPAYAGQGIGREMLNWAETKARATGKKYLRLNCIAADKKIREYYENAGFIRVRDVMGPKALATLYEKPL